jgi:hypothetical protein
MGGGGAVFRGLGWPRRAAGGDAGAPTSARNRRLSAALGAARSGGKGGGGPRLYLYGVGRALHGTDAEVGSGWPSSVSPNRFLFFLFLLFFFPFFLFTVFDITLVLGIQIDPNQFLKFCKIQGFVLNNSEQSFEPK